MRAVVLLIVGLAVGAALGWQGEVHAASSRQSDNVAIPVNGVASFRSVGESCRAVGGFSRGGEFHPYQIFCYQTIPRKHGYTVVIMRRSIMVYIADDPLNHPFTVRQRLR